MFRSPLFWVIIVGTACRIPVLWSPITYSTDVWRQADTASIAHNFVAHGMRILMPQINWGGAGPGYVEAEFQLFPFVTAVLHQVFGEHVWLGQALSLSLSVGTMCLFSNLAHRHLPAEPRCWLSPRLSARRSSSGSRWRSCPKRRCCASTSRRS